MRGTNHVSHPILAGGWFHSGESWMYKEDGGQVIVDRYKDIIESGGENLLSQRVEGVTAEDPAVAGVAVVGVPDPKWGEAVVVLRQGTAATADEIITHAHGSLTGLRLVEMGGM